MHTSRAVNAISKNDWCTHSSDKESSPPYRLAIVKARHNTGTMAISHRARAITPPCAMMSSGSLCVGRYWVLAATSNLLKYTTADSENNVPQMGELKNLCKAKWCSASGLSC